jgi:hypothetical protein
MSENADKPNLFDPLGMMKNLRESGMENWSKAMLEMVNSDSFTTAQAEALNAWLTSSTPFRKLLEDTITQSLRVLRLPSTDDYVRLTERITNIEMRLDDMDAKLDRLLESLGPNS